MAKFPLAIESGGRPSLRSQRQISVDRSIRLVSTAMVEAGEAFAAFSKEHVDKEDSFKYASAKAQYLTADIKARRDLEENPDWETWEPSYRDTMNKVRDDALNLIRDSNDRRLLELELNVDVERGVTLLTTLARKREVDQGRAQLTSDAADLLTASYEATTFTDREAAIGAMRGLYAGARDRDLPFITAVEAEREMSEWEETYAVGLLSVMDPEMRTPYLANPEGNIASKLDKPKRELMLRQSREEGKITRDRRKATEHTDGIMDKFGHPGGRKGALAMVSKIKDTDVQARTREMVNGRFAEMNQIDLEQIKAYKENATAIISTTGGTGDIPANQLAALYRVPGMEKTINDFVRYIRSETGENIEPLQYDDMYYKWTQLSTEKQLSTDVYLEYRPWLDDLHYERAVAWQQDLRKAKEGDASARKRVNSGLTMKQLISNALILSPMFKERPTAKTSSAIERRWARIEGHIDNMIVAASEAEGDLLTPTAMRKIINDETIKFSFIDVFGTDPQRFFENMSEEELTMAYTPFDDIPEKDMKPLENHASSQEPQLFPSKRTYGRAHAAWLRGEFGLALSILETED